MVHPREMNWSPAEKKIARAAFDRVLIAEKEAVIRQLRERLARIRGVDDIDDLWAIEGWLNRRRKAIDDKFDFRYSVLPQVFVQMIVKGELEESELAGLGGEKLKEIRRNAEFMRELARRLD